MIRALRLDVLDALSLRRRLGRAVGAPEALALRAPVLWIAVALLARVAGLERVEAVAVGRFLQPAIRTFR